MFQTEVYLLEVGHIFSEINLKHKVKHLKIYQSGLKHEFPNVGY